MQDAMQEASASFADAVAKVVQSSRAGRSVLDYDDPQDLREALEACVVSAGHACAEPPPGTSDWLLPVPDPEAEPQTVPNEMQRLLTLKSYLLLDAEKEEAFDKLTREACEIYNVPTSLISLVDLGRQFLLSNSNADDDVRETSRTSAFCSHTILSKTGICVVPDTINDPRFRNNNLVTGGPKLRFYAGAPLISPEGYKLGTFCVEGPDPRPQGLSLAEQEKLKEFAAKAMALMVERRKVMQRAYNAGNLPANAHLRRHAAVTTNLGALVYRYYMNESVTAMRLFQESVQTMMHVEEEEQKDNSVAVGGIELASKERQKNMSKLLEQMNSAETREQRDAILIQIRAMFQDIAALMPLLVDGKIHTVDIIPGLFTASSKLKGAPSQVQMQGLFFNEAFDVSLEAAKAFDPQDPHSNLDDRSFIIPIDQCSKATLFNMGLIHYHWGSADSAMQYFDLAASLSQQHDATHFDPVVLGSLNNMAQINLHYGRSSDAMALLSDALTRGNAALTTIYGGGGGSDDMSCSSTDSETQEMRQLRQNHEIRRTRRLRRKLARTLFNIGHVHFFKCDYDEAMSACVDALKLLHTNLEEIEVAAVWYNMALVHYHKGNKVEALQKIEQFLDLAQKVLPAGSHVQLADALHRKGKIMFEMGNLYDSMTPLNEALKMRRSLLGENHSAVAESFCLIGKVLQEREEYDFALNALEKGLAVQRHSLSAAAAISGDDQLLSFEVAQTLLEIGRAHHAKDQLQEALLAYLEVADVTRKFFGDRHPFVARIDNIIGNLYLEAGDTDKSLLYFQKAMEIQVEHGIIVDMAVVQDPLLKVDIQANPGAHAA